MDERALFAALGTAAATPQALAQALNVPVQTVIAQLRSWQQIGVPIAEHGGHFQLLQRVDLLDSAQISAALPASARALLHALQLRWQVDSTNTQIIQQTLPARGTQVLLAEQQTAGRGRRGRHWVSPPACNIYMSLARGFEGGLARLAGLSIAAGVAVADALQALGYCHVQLKWPNDVLLGGHKLGGILVEGAGMQGTRAMAVIGIGLNVYMPADAGQAIQQPWAALAQAQEQERQPPHSRNQIVAQLLTHLLHALQLFEQAGLAAFLPRFTHYDALHMQPIQVAYADGRSIQGQACGVAEDGALQVQVEGQLQHVYAGEVSIRPRHLSANAGVHK